MGCRAIRNDRRAIAELLNLFKILCLNKINYKAKLFEHKTIKQAVDDS